VQRSLLVIPQHTFTERNLEQYIQLDKKYDLCISLEVGEHIIPECAKTFIKSLTDASDFVLFSAAIPFQRGKNHVNLQWPKYWAAVFSEYGYLSLDLVRFRIWGNDKIPSHYQQNIVFYVKKERIGELKDSEVLTVSVTNTPISIVHPFTYTKRAKEGESVRGALKLVRRAIRAWVRKKLRNSS
jgi:hypothetical protein